MQALAEPNHETWSSLVMATSATSPAIVAFQLPVMVLLEKFKPHLLLRLNRRLAEIDKKIYKGIYRMHLYIVSLLQTPQACISIASHLL